MEKFLFTHFTGEHDEGEQVYFSVSEDGRNFVDLNEGLPVLRSTIGNEGIRDPFIIRDEKKNKFYIIATDLTIGKGEGWAVAQERGSLNIVVWESEDLVTWSEPRLLPVNITGAGNVWAPEAIYDHKEKAFLLFWASKVNGKHKMYGAYTQDFKELGMPFQFMEKEHDVIDSTVIEKNGTYYRFTKDETTSRIIMEKSNTLTKDYELVEDSYLSSLEGVEGPEIYKVDNQWFLIVDCFAKGLGYTILVTDNLGVTDFTPMPKEEYHFGTNLKRHGGVLAITDEEYSRLLTKYQSKN